MIVQIKARAPVFLSPIAFADIVINLFVFFFLCFGVLATFEARPPGTLPIQLPKGGERAHQKETQPVTVVINASGTVLLEGKVVLRSRLKASVNHEIAKRKVRDVVVRADRAVTLQHLLPVLDTLRTTDAHSVSIATVTPASLRAYGPSGPEAQ